MSLISWKDEYSVNHKAIDDQHKKLVELINKLYDAMKQAKGKMVLGEIIKELVSYTIFHFNYEEKVMSQNNYPGYMVHKSEHQMFTQKVRKLESDYKNGKAILSQDVLQFLKGWLVDHIIVNDKKYAPYLKETGVPKQVF